MNPDNSSKAAWSIQPLDEHFVSVTIKRVDGTEIRYRVRREPIFPPVGTEETR